MVTRRVSEVELDSVQSSLTRRVSNLVTSSGYHLHSAKTVNEKSTASERPITLLRLAIS